MRPSSNQRAFSLLETMCVVTILGTLAALLYPIAQSAIIQGKITRSKGNMRQIHTALLLYTSDEGGGPMDLPPPGPPADRFWTALPDGLLNTGAGGSSHAYRTMWTYDPQTWRATWAEDCRVAGGNPLVLVDDTYPLVQERGPFIKSHHTGIFWDGHIATRWYAGSPEPSRNWFPSSSDD